MTETLVDFRDRRGKPMELRKWAERWEDMRYRVVACHQVGPWLVRTRWEGVVTVGHLFYTAVSGDGGKTWIDVAHADTETDAILAHNRVTRQRATQEQPCTS